MSVIDEMSLPYPPSVAILPLGTCNDLANLLGWGSRYYNQSMKILLSRVINGKNVKLDR